jgi:hypothetical protein
MIHFGQTQRVELCRQNRVFGHFFGYNFLFLLRQKSTIALAREDVKDKGEMR